MVSWKLFPGGRRVRLYSNFHFLVNLINRLVGATLVVALIESGRSQGSPLRKKQYNYNLKVRIEGALSGRKVLDVWPGV